MVNSSAGVASGLSTGMGIAVRWLTSIAQVAGAILVQARQSADIVGHLRCMVCQNQSIDDSDAPLAKDLRLLVRERVKAGDSDPQIIEPLRKQ